MKAFCKSSRRPIPQLVLSVGFMFEYDCVNEMQYYDTHPYSRLLI